VSPADARLDEQTYKGQRDFSLQIARDQTQFIDQAILTLSGGALGISLTFLEKFVSSNGAVKPGILLTAWVVLTVSIVAVLISMHTSQWAIDRYVEDLDKNQRTGEAIKFNYWTVVLTEILNYLASVLLIIGIGLLCWFAYVNHPPKL
jgi:hypothetical protein